MKLFLCGLTAILAMFAALAAVLFGFWLGAQLNDMKVGMLTGGALAATCMWIVATCTGKLDDAYRDGTLS